MVASRIAIIPARGGSKRLPKKNILDFMESPMISWTIKAALDSNLFERVLVSTDDEEIAEVSIAHGADVPFLRSEAVDDHSPVSLATVAALEQAQSYWQKSFDTVVQLMANCPLRNAHDIKYALVQFDKHRNFHPFQISCFRYVWMNPWWAAELSTSGEPSRLFPQALSQRSQDLPELFCPTGAIWIARRTALLGARTFYGPTHRYHPMDWRASIDIDDHEDLVMARTLALMPKY